MAECFFIRAALQMLYSNWNEKKDWKLIHLNIWPSWEMTWSGWAGTRFQIFYIYKILNDSSSNKFSKTLVVSYIFISKQYPSRPLYFKRKETNRVVEILVHFKLHWTENGGYCFIPFAKFQSEVHSYKMTQNFSSWEGSFPRCY